MWLFVGVVLMIAPIALVRNLDILASYKYTLMLVGLALLLSPLIPGIGTDAGMGSQIWLSVGSFSFQPGEIAKICIVLFLAGYPRPEPRDAFGVHARGRPVPPA